MEYPVAFISKYNVFLLKNKRFTLNGAPTYSVVKEFGHLYGYTYLIGHKDFYSPCYKEEDLKLLHDLNELSLLELKN